MDLKPIHHPCSHQTDPLAEFPISTQNESFLLLSKEGFSDPILSYL
jgi:hypothetical protein